MRAERRPGKYTTKKTFVKGERIDVQRAVGTLWQPATYLGKITEMRGWHRVELVGDAVPVIIDSMTGMRTDEARNDRTYTTRRIIVPTQRTRKVGI